MIYDFSVINEELASVFDNCRNWLEKNWLRSSVITSENITVIFIKIIWLAISSLYNFSSDKDENSIQQTSVYYQPPSIIEPDAYYSSPAEQYKPSATLNYEDVYAHVGMLFNYHDWFAYIIFLNSRRIQSHLGPGCITPRNWWFW